MVVINTAALEKLVAYLKERGDEQVRIDLTQAHELVVRVRNVSVVLESGENSPTIAVINTGKL